jgi:hypothetical protein
MQQFPFIDLFKSALHVSGDVFAHLQEQFNCIYSFGTSFGSSNSTVSPVSSRSVHCTKAGIYSEIAPEDGRRHRPKHVELI